ncbi:epoxide hydrolase family protein [Pseudohongiella sp. O18]|uniref:epoxide hydrolase family protein n=1 Tax=Pseudohongiella sp. O18 TaxID=2904248 RepID=UPI001F22C9A7|nr:epoxide hydrolase family protein [Pseudohongiella sp. O18]
MPVSRTIRHLINTLCLCIACTTLQAQPAGDSAIMPFEIHVPDEAIADLRYRLANARLPAQIPGTGWEYGTNAQYLTELVDYWQHQFDWREQERQLNTLDQYVTTIDGVPIHFIHQRSSNPDATPLMITHGWPGSIAEFRHIIGPLTEPQQHGGNAEDAFHVIAPSLPGFGFSGEPQERGFNPERMAQILAALMQRLGYDQYGLQGGDWGAIINRIHAHQFADRVLGLHSNFVLASPPEDPAIRDDVTEEEMTARRERQAFMADEVGYQQIQGTKPQTLGVALNDSPAGLAAWIVEKFHGWSDIDRQSVNGLDTRFSKDDLLTDISIYWFSASITSSARIYYENRNFPAAEPLGYVEVPTAGAIFPKEIYLTPRRWAEEQYNIVRWTLMPRGGHFAAMEEPELLLDDVRAFFRSL